MSSVTIPRARSGAIRSGGSFLPKADPQRIAGSLVIFVLTLWALWSFGSLDISLSNIMQSWPNALRFVDRALPLDFPPVAEIAWQTLITLAIVICGTALAALLSLPIAYLAARNTSPHPSLRWLGRALGVIARSMPDAVLAMIFAMVLSRGALPGILALGLHSVGMISKLFADAIEQIDEGPRLALRASGATKAQEFWGGIFPQILPSLVATVLLRNDINMRVSVILGFVGVYGLGYQISFAMQTLDYRRAMALAIVMFFLCVAMEMLSSVIRRNLLGVQRQRKQPKALAAPAATTAEPASRRRPWTMNRIQLTVITWGTVAVLAVSVLVSSTQTSPIHNFWENLAIQWNRLWPPFFSESGAQKILPALLETVEIALAATLLSVVFSLILGSFAARNVAPNVAVRSGFRLALVGIRGIPELLLALVLIVITGLGPTAAVLALGIGGIGVLGKLMADSIEEISHGPERALKAVGGSRTQVYASATLPQSAPAFISSTLYVLDSNVRAATILGIVGGGGVGFMLQQSTTINQHQMLAILMCIFAVVLLVEVLSMILRKVFK